MAPTVEAASIATAQPEPPQEVVAAATATPSADIPSTVLEALGIPDPEQNSAAETAVQHPPPPVARQFGGNAPTRITIPAIDVDAPMITLGFASDGSLDIPYDAVSVGWYTVTPPPGQPGNSLLGAHVDWRGELAVFWRLRDLQSGDLIYIERGEQTLVYRVRESFSVAFTANVGDVLRSTPGESSVTLFTCGGTFNRSRGEYDERLIVHAVQVQDSVRAVD